MTGPGSTSARRNQFRRRDAAGAPSPQAPRARLIGFSVAALLTGMLLLLAGVQALLSPWVLPSDTGDAHAELHRWFLTVAGVVDTCGALVILTWGIRPHTVLLGVYTFAAVVIATVINLPVDPWFGVLLLVFTPMLVLYPYWSRARDLRTWWDRPIRPLLWVGLATVIVVVVVAGVSFVRQFTAHDTAAAANWWADYAEHLALLGIGLLFAATGRPGWRLIAVTWSSAWIYLSLVALVVIPDQYASWGTRYAPLGLVVGAVTAAALLRTRGAPEHHTE